MRTYNLGQHSMNYWSATDGILAVNGGKNPSCPTCGEQMVPQDDHGRFVCFNCPSGEPRMRIPQFKTNGMSDAKKAKIPPLNRLHDTPTGAEAELLALLIKGPDVMDSDKYRKVVAKVKEKGFTRR